MPHPLEVCSASVYGVGHSIIKGIIDSPATYKVFFSLNYTKVSIIDAAATLLKTVVEIQSKAL